MKTYKFQDISKSGLTKAEFFHCNLEELKVDSLYHATDVFFNNRYTFTGIYKGKTEMDAKDLMYFVFVNEYNGEDVLIDSDTMSHWKFIEL